MSHQDRKQCRVYVSNNYPLENLRDSTPILPALINEKIKGGKRHKAAILEKLD